MKGLLMFKITYLVDDKRLPDMLRSCSGSVFNLEVVPVSGAEPVKPAKANGTSAPRVQEANDGEKNFCRELGLAKGRQFRLKDVKQLMPRAGYKPLSAWYAITHEMKAKRVKRVGVGLYEVV